MSVYDVKYFLWVIYLVMAIILGRQYYNPCLLWRKLEA